MMSLRLTALALILLFAQLGAATDPRAVEENRIGSDLMEAGDYEGSIKHFLTAVEVDPRYAVAHSNLGLAYYHLERYEEALDEFKTAVKLAPNYPQYRIYLSGAYERCGMAEEAADALENALSLMDTRGEDGKAREEIESMMERMKGEDDTRDHQGSYPSMAGEPVFSFVVISDVHIGENTDGGTQDSDNLNWILNTAYDAIRPSFIVNTGDITDSTNGGFIPMGGPYQQEWDEYSRIISTMSENAYYDIPGNHDQYRDGDLSYYLENSLQGRATGYTQQTWFVDLPEGRYQFMSVCTPGNDGKPWPIDNAGLDDGELNWIESHIDRNAKKIFFFGHHPLDDLEYGRREFQSILDSHPSVYVYGHTHGYGISYYNNTMLVNAASLGKSPRDHYLLVTVSADGQTSVAPYTIPQLPV